MKGHVTNDYHVVGASADEIWAFHSSPDFPKLLMILEPTAYKSVDVLVGDGGVGTVMEVVPAKGIPERFTGQIMELDDRNRVKRVQRFAGFKEIGFSFYEDTFEILEQDANSCIIRSTVTAHLDDKFEINASLISINARYGLSREIAKYVIEKKQESVNLARAQANGLSREIAKYVIEKKQESVNLARAQATE